MQVVTPGFGELLGEVSAALDDDDSTVYGLSADLRLACLNEGWFRFARDNGGEPAISERWHLGAPLLDAIAPVLRPFYRDLFHGALTGEPRPRRPLLHHYECSSPTTYRRLTMAVYPLRGHGLLTVHSLRVERPHDGPAVESPERADYRDKHGFYTQCAHCRRFRNYAGATRWEWIPAWVERCPEDTSHGLCEPCFAYYYGTH